MTFEENKTMFLIELGLKLIGIKVDWDLCPAYNRNGKKAFFIFAIEFVTSLYISGPSQGLKIRGG